MMRELLERRAAELQGEYEHGAAMLQQMDRDREALAQTLLRISGAQTLVAELRAELDAAEQRAKLDATESAEGGDDDGNH